MKLYLGLAFGIGILLAAPAKAQSGAAGGGFMANSRVEITDFSVHAGEPRTTRLSALVVWRGRQPHWGTTTTQSAHKAVSDSMAARRASHRMERVAGGGCMPIRCAWAEFDADGRTLHLLQRSFAVPGGDSTLVVLVDDVDQPTLVVETFVIASSPRTQPAIASGDTARMFREMDLQVEHFRAIARSEPRINRFVGEWEEYPPMRARGPASDGRPRR